MKIQYCSDLHLEFRENNEFLKLNPLEPKADILVLVGDIIPFAIMEKHKDFFNYISDNFQLTYWLPGNHEYYYSDISERSGALNERIRDNIFLVNNISFRHDNVKLIFSTLWSKISPVNEWQIEQSVSDFQVIKFNGRRFSASICNQLHLDSVAFIEKELNHSQDSKILICTHHTPTFFNYPEMYKGSAINEAFAVELFSFIETSNVDYWIYGHHHSNVADFRIGKTKLLTNQLGYVKYNEHQLFRQDKCIIL